MDTSKKQILISAGVDLDGAMERFMNNEKLYHNFLNKFITNPNFTELETLIGQKDWEQALTISHNLKGVSGSLGFTKLYEQLVTQVNLLRQQKNEEAAAMMDDIMAEYHRMMDVINNL